MPPIAVAANLGHVDMIELLHKRGANLEASAPRDVFDVAGNKVFRKGWRPLHCAICGTHVAYLNVLLKLGANPNGTDATGFTPLMTANCLVAVEGRRCSLVQALLEGGADPALACDAGLVALHYSAGEGDTEVMGMLLRRAPSTLNMVDNKGLTALHHAAVCGHITAVSHLLSAGATDETLFAQTGMSALLGAIHECHVAVVRLLLDEGMEAVGGMQAMSMAFEVAIGAGRATILQMLLAVQVGAGGSEEKWAQQTLGYVGLPALHFAVVSGSLSTVHVLLAAGADETALSSRRQRASDFLGRSIAGGSDKDAAGEAAIGRMLERGPAFRARSWKWLARVNSSVNETRRKPWPSVGVRVFRQGNSPVFTIRFARYANK